MTEEFRSGRCAILGRPNVGKSTLLNHLLGQKLVIATPKPGTTRSAVLGVYVSDEPPTQLAFVDTPGIAKSSSPLHDVLVDQATQSLLGADVVLFLTESPSDQHTVRPSLNVRDADRPAIAALRETKLPILLAVNKVDRLRDKRMLLPFLENYSRELPFQEMIPISALTGEQTPRLIELLRRYVPEGKLYDDDDFLTDRPTRFFAAELIREAVLNHVQKEVPYGAAVTIDKMEDDTRISRIMATIVVEKDSHKGIVIGRAGARLKTIGTEARLAIEAFIGKKVHLELWVKVLEGWTQNPVLAKRYATDEQS